jgi:hypothetical protein
MHPCDAEEQSVFSEIEWAVHHGVILEPGGLDMFWRIHLKTSQHFAATFMWPANNVQKTHI